MGENVAVPAPFSHPFPRINVFLPDFLSLLQISFHVNSTSSLRFYANHVMITVQFFLIFVSIHGIFLYIYILYCVIVERYNQNNVKAKDINSNFKPNMENIWCHGNHQAGVQQE